MQHDHPIPDESGRREPPPDDHIVGEHPERIGPYRVLRVLGEGGMGVVYLAEQTEPVRREVALKILKLGMDTRQVVARFEAERQSLAVMEHPGIATVFDAGATESGRPFFVMERVDGEPITDHCDRHRLPVRQRVQLFLQVCRAVQHAHQKGVIHRDLKPSNVLVTDGGDGPLCKVIDFGIARAVECDTEARTRLTQVEQSLGTPAYMSPEQAVGSGLDVDTRTDIYSLGVLLYELLAGMLPFEPQAYRGWAFVAHHLSKDPPRPSVRFAGLPAEEQTRLAAARGAGADAVRRALRGDLDWIVMRALEKERERRYETATGFALDLERHLAHEPVLASPPSRAYQARKFVLRHRIGVAFSGATAVFLVAFAVSMAVQADRVAHARDLALARQGQAEELIGFMVGDLRGKLTPVGRLDILDEVGQRALAYFAAVPESELTDAELFRRAEAIRQLGEVRFEQGDLAGAEETFREALAATQRLGARDPTRAEWQVALGAAHYWVGYVHWMQSNLDGALAEFVAYREIAERLVSRDAANPEWRRELGHAYSNLGSVQEARGDLQGALSSFQAMLPLREAVAQHEGGDRSARFSLAVAHNKIAVVQQKMGLFADAAEGFRQVLAIKEALVLEDPDDVPMRDHLALANTFRGRSLLQQGLLAEATPRFEASLAIYRELTAHDPENGEWRTALGHRLLDLAGARQHAGDLAGAVALVQEGTEVFGALHRSSPPALGPRRSLASSRRALGSLALVGGDPQRALRELRAAAEAFQRILGDAPADRRAALGLAEALLLQGEAYMALGRRAEAEGAWRRAQAVLEPLQASVPEVEARALWSAVLLRTGRQDAASGLVDELYALGYREPGFLQLVQRPSSPRVRTTRR
jgi:eukaryotic-like serine/threonine-protein kinase